jgi:hypothetical protein
MDDYEVGGYGYEREGEKAGREDIRDLRMWANELQYQRVSD